MTVLVSNLGFQSMSKHYEKPCILRKYKHILVCALCSSSTTRKKKKKSRNHFFIWHPLCVVWTWISKYLKTHPCVSMIFPAYIWVVPTYLKFLRYFSKNFTGLSYTALLINTTLGKSTFSHLPLFIAAAPHTSTQYVLLRNSLIRNSVEI